MTEELSPQQKAGKKGAAMRHAKLQAAETGEPVPLPEYGITIQPDGTVIEGALPQGGATMTIEDAQSAEDAEAEANAIAPQLKSIAQELDALIAGGCSEDEALLIVNRRRGLAGESPNAMAQAAGQQPRTPGDGEQLGPDPAVVAAYAERMKSYVAPKLDKRIGEGGVLLPMRFAEYVERMAQWETFKRRRMKNPVTVEEVIAIIIRQHWHQNATDRVLIMNPHSVSSSGPAQAFNPNEGTFG